MLSVEDVMTWSCGLLTEPIAGDAPENLRGGSWQRLDSYLLISTLGSMRGGLCASMESCVWITTGL